MNINNYILSKTKYVSEIYHETQRELAFTDITTNNTYIKVIVTPDGMILKENSASYSL